MKLDSSVLFSEYSPLCIKEGGGGGKQRRGKREAHVPSAGVMERKKLKLCFNNLQLRS